MKRFLIAAVAACLVATQSHAAAVGSLRTPNGRLVLSDQGSKDCPDNTKMAAFVTNDGEIIPACWFERIGHVWVVMANGEAAGIRKSLFHFEDV